MTKFIIGDLYQWVNSDGELCIDKIKEHPETGEPYFWNIDFQPEQYFGLEKLDVSVPYFNPLDVFVGDL